MDKITLFLMILMVMGLFIISFSVSVGILMFSVFGVLSLASMAWNILNE